jgi:hypothetical protein
MRRGLADLDVLQHLGGGHVDHVHHAGHFGGDVERLAVGADLHALGLLATLTDCSTLPLAASTKLAASSSLET